MAEKEYSKALDVAQEELAGMYLAEDDMGYQTLLAKVEQGYFLEMSQQPNEWRESFVKPPEINKNQQIVLEWLKEVYTDNDEGYFSVISYLTKPTTEEEVRDPAHIALACLNPDEEVQVLAAFAEWGMKEVAE